ncbi:hypothetical protein [uncultured Flavonifractor sp.]|uniref:hypothetical protein n=1 Tax=uncultured Flavonifractor sp. TaxID=1193534 RepID=UPI00260D01CD|nr:hypothetical protein [uncultured Flavonifractor sp.]
MKRLIPLLAVLLLLGGCTGSCQDTEAVSTVLPSASPTPEVEQSAAPTSTPKPSPTPTARPTPTPEPTATPKPSVEPSPTPIVYDGPNDEEVLSAYRAAVEAFWWFQVEPLPFDETDSREVDGVTYYRVDYPGIDSTVTLRGYLKSLFSDDLVEKLLPYDGTQYVDIDGTLYVQDGGRGTDITRGAETAQVLRDGDPNRCTVRVTVEVLDPEQGGAVVDTLTFDFPYEKVGEKWIFTDFSLVR